MRPTVVVDEYQETTVDGLRPSFVDHARIESPGLRSRLDLRWLGNDRLLVRATQHVGVVELDCVTIQVRPKLAGTELDVLAMFDYAQGSHALRDLADLRAMPGAGHHLRDLVCLLLTRACDDLLRRGLRRDYLRWEEAVPAVRGRLLPDRQLVRRYGRLDRLECRFDEFDGDILDNRLCAAALQDAARTARDGAVRAGARRTAARFAEICDPSHLDPALVAERLSYHRGNEHYRAAHRWALLLLRLGGFRDLYSRTDQVSGMFMLDMNVLFEAFIVRLLREAVRGTDLTVRAGESMSGAICRADGTSYTTITPDVRLVRGHGSTPWQRSVDAKYKLYADRQISTPDLYQSFTYGSALSGTAQGGTPTACILYAGLKDQEPQTVVLRDVTGAAIGRIVAAQLNVPAVLDVLGTQAERPRLEGLLAALTGE